MSFDIQNGILRAYIPDDYKPNITIPDGVTEIGNGAFRLAKGLTHITIPEGVIKIGSHAFFMCTAISVKLPASLREIDRNAFFCCRSLKTVTIAEGLIKIGSAAFRDCQCLKHIDIPDSVVIIDAYAFCGCISLRSIRLPDSLGKIGDFAFEQCNLKELKIPPLITTIPTGAFSLCASLRSVTLHSQIKHIGNNAFSSCVELSEVNYTPGDTEINIDGDAFESTKWQENYPNDFVTLNGFLCKYKGEAKEVVIPDTVKHIGQRAFYNLRITSVTIPSSVETIHFQAFELCDDLKKLTIGAHSICQHAFITPSLEELVLEDTVKDIHSGAFLMAYSLRTVTYLHSTADMPEYILPPFADGLTYIYAPNADISVFDKRDEAFSVSYCDVAAAGYAEMAINDRSISPEIAEGYHKYLKEHCNSLLKYASENESILNYFCRHKTLDLKATDYLLEQYSKNTVATALLLQYKHNNFGDGQDYEL